MQNSGPEKGIGQRIRALRKRFGYTQQQMAEMLDLTTEHYRSMENGRRGVTSETLRRLKRIFNVTADYLLDGSCEENDISLLEALVKGADSAIYPDIVKAVAFVIELHNRGS